MSNSPDSELVTAAISAATEGDVAAFAALIGVRPPDVYAWRRGDVNLSAVGRSLLRCIVAHPRAMRRWLTDTRG